MQPLAVAAALVGSAARNGFNALRGFLGLSAARQGISRKAHELPRDLFAEAEHVSLGRVCKRAADPLRRAVQIRHRQRLVSHAEQAGDVAHIRHIIADVVQGVLCRRREVELVVPRVLVRAEEPLAGHLLPHIVEPHAQLLVRRQSVAGGEEARQQPQHIELRRRAAVQLFVHSVEQERAEQRADDDPRQPPRGFLLPELCFHLAQPRPENVLRNVFPAIQRLDLEQVDHLRNEVFRLERQRRRALRARSHHVAAPSIRRAQGFLLALALGQLLAVSAAHGDGAHQVVHALERPEQCRRDLVALRVCQVANAAFLRQEVAPVGEVALRLSACDVSDCLGNVLRPQLARDERQLRRLVQRGREIARNVRTGECAHELAPHVQRHAPDLALHAAVVKELLSCELVPVVVQPCDKIAVFRRLRHVVEEVFGVLFHRPVHRLIAELDVIVDDAVCFQEQLLFLRRCEFQVFRLLDQRTDVVRRVLPAEILRRRAHAHHVVRMIQNVAEIVDVLLKALLNVIVRARSLSVLEKRIVPLVRLELLRQSRDARGQLADLRAQVDADRLERAFELVALRFRLEVLGVPLDEADRLVAVRHEEVVDRGIEFIIEPAVLFRRVLHSRLVHASAVQLSLCFEPVCVALCKLALLLAVQAKFPRRVRHLRAVEKVLRRVNDLLLDLALADHFLHGLALNHELCQRTLALRQRRVLTVRSLEGAHLVVHAVDEALSLLLVDVDRFEDRLVDLLSSVPAEDRAHAALRRAVIQGEAALRRDTLPALRCGEFSFKVLVEEVFHLFLQPFADLSSALFDEVCRHGLLCAVVVCELHHLAVVHRRGNVLLVVQAGCDVPREVLLLRRRTKAFDRLARLALNDLRCLVVGDELVNDAVIARAVLDLHAQLFERLCAAEFVLAPVPQPLGLFRCLLRTPAGKIGVQIREFLHVRLLAALILHAPHGLLHAFRHAFKLPAPLVALVLRREAHVVPVAPAECDLRREVALDDVRRKRYRTIARLHAGNVIRFQNVIPQPRYKAFVVVSGSAVNDVFRVEQLCKAVVAHVLIVFQLPRCILVCIVARLNDLFLNVGNVRQGRFLYGECSLFVASVPASGSIRFVGEHRISGAGHWVVAGIEPVRKPLLSIKLIDCLIERDALLPLFDRPVVEACEVSAVAFVLRRKLHLSPLLARQLPRHFLVERAVLDIALAL